VEHGVKYAYVDSPIGELLLAGDEHVLRELHFAGARPEPTWEHDPEALAEPARQLREYFAGERREFELELEMAGTDFQRAVWDLLKAIPYGETTTYGEIANALGRPDRARAVGAANGRNPIAIIVPCHRVIGADGSLVGFGGGLNRKKALLALEHALPERLF
jgi:methylated-DNA-[protein]-cysteine S-methyltransferase